MLRKIGLFVWLACSFAGVASAQVAMLTQVSGDVRVSGRDGARGAVAFLKVNEGDTLTLAGSARVQMVYLANGRQEVWTGAGPVVVGSAQGRSQTLTAATSQVPALVLRQLEKTPAVGQHGKTGMVMLRSMDNLEKIDGLETDYKALRAGAVADDTTPELFYLTGLLDLGAYEDVRVVLNDVKARVATQPAYAAMVEHFERLLAEATAK
ncbi:MAG: hypothetical protein ABL982_04155 [Vicinamibacterales bacterium]